MSTTAYKYRKTETGTGLHQEHWATLRHHPVQRAFFKNNTRYEICHSGRRGGKTEIVRRKKVKKACSYHSHSEGFFGFFAPTRPQAKRIYWSTLKRLIPKSRVKDISETELRVTLDTNVHLIVAGTDAVERLEGTPWDDITLDEYGNMKEDVWDEHLEPALIDRKGHATFIGVPEGRNHYYDLVQDAHNDEDWQVFHWHSREIHPEEVKKKEGKMDPRTFDQEFGGQFISFEGKIYYDFDKDIHALIELPYDPKADLNFCFDFNIKPGPAVVNQEHRIQLPHLGSRDPIPRWKTCCIGEVFIRENSTTRLVCEKLIEDWGKHQGDIYCYGDATGGAGGSAQLDGSNWDIIFKILAKHFGDERVHFRVPKANPDERVRINAVNTRINSTDDLVSLAVDPRKCPNLVRCLDGTQAQKGTNGKIEKVKGTLLSHLSDGLGYYIHREFPITEHSFETAAVQ